MNFKSVRKGIVIATLVGSMMIPVGNSVAAEDNILSDYVKQQKAAQVDDRCLLNVVAEIQKQENTEKAIRIESSEAIKFNDKMSRRVFVRGAKEYLLVVSAPEENSDWIGKVFDSSVVKILENGNAWSKIESGKVVGYVKTESLITGREAAAKAKSILTGVYPDRDIFTLTDEEIEAGFSLGETREDEEARIAAEEAAKEAAYIAEEQARIAAEEAARRQKGVDLVNFAKQFIGNPYVWGGTSLTRGADCSGFVVSVYAKFGVSLPHSSYELRKVGYAVSYRDIQPGDIICYSGHVGIYAGNGKIVNAIDENKGIGLSNARFKSIITIRRIF